MICPECGKRMKREKKDYKYVESGLDNIVLKGIDVYTCECGEEMPAIRDMSGLHKVIAYCLAKAPMPLTGGMFRFIRKALKLTQSEVGSILEVTKVTVSRWETGETPIGPANDKLIRMFYIQTLEEKCDRVFAGSFSSVASIRRKSRISGPIEVDTKKWEKLCGRPKECAV